MSGFGEFGVTESEFQQKLLQKASEKKLDIFDVAFAEMMDAEDPLAEFRSEFLFPTPAEGKKMIYLCGNSLGLQPKGVKREIDKFLKKWETEGVEGHFTG
jgi:kynureninase